MATIASPFCYCHGGNIFAFAADINRHRYSDARDRYPFTFCDRYSHAHSCNSYAFPFHDKHSYANTGDSCAFTVPDEHSHDDTRGGCAVAFSNEQRHCDITRFHRDTDSDGWRAAYPEWRFRGRGRVDL
jgi:hypothetical protein